MHRLILAFDIAIAAYLVLAVTTLNKPADKATVCSEVNIHIDNAQTDGFLSSDEIKRMLQTARIYPLAQPLASIDARTIEETLAKNPFVQEAQCFKAQDGHLCINLRQRTPIVHVMNTAAENYYVDTAGALLPEPPRPANTMIATGHISNRYAQGPLTKIALAVAADPFWRHQVQQINILPDGSAELVPTVGSHIIYLGPPVSIPKKLSRLTKFYKYGLNVAGWNKYRRISVEFDNQIICKK